MPVEIPEETRRRIAALTAERDAGRISPQEFRRQRMAALEDAGVVYTEEVWEPDARVGRAAILVGVVMGSIAFVATGIAVTLLLIG